MKRLLITFVMLLGLSAGAIGGCEIMTPAAVIESRTQMEKLTESVDAYQDIVVDLTDQLEKDNLISAEVVKTLAGVSKKVDELQPLVIDGITAVMEAEYSGDKIVDAIIGAKALNKATASVNPYAPVVDYGLEIILGLFGVGATGVALLKSKENTIIKGDRQVAWKVVDKVNTEINEYAVRVDEATAKYKAIKQGTEQFKVNNPDKAAELYTNIGNAGMRNGGTG